MADDTGEIGREAAEAVDFENIKTNGGASSFYAAMQMADAVSHQRAMVMKREAQMDVGTAIAGKIAEMIINTSVSEGASTDMLVGYLSKFFQQTPPPTNIPTQGQ